MELTRRDVMRLSSLAAGGLTLGFVSACSSSASTSSAPLAAASSGGSLADIEAQAKSEGTILVYGLDSGLATALQNGFTAQYPWAKVQNFVGSGSDLESKVLTEVRAGAAGADLVMMAGAAVNVYEKADALAAFSVPNDKTLPAGWADPTGLAHPVYQVPTILIRNTNLVKTGVSDLYELIDPKWAGNLVFDQPQNLGGAATFLASHRQQWGDAKWTTWLEGLAKNKALIAADTTTSYQDVLTGERPIGVGEPDDVLSEAKGAPVAMDFYQGIATNPVYIGQPRTSKRPGIAALYTNWLISQAGQQVFASTSRTPVLNISSPVSLSTLLPSGVSALPPSALSGFFKDPQSYLDIWNQYWPS
jgi:iron(III) transport system substrate-binding protein